MRYKLSKIGIVFLKFCNSHIESLIKQLELKNKCISGFYRVVFLGLDIYTAIFFSSENTVEDFLNFISSNWSSKSFFMNFSIMIYTVGSIIWRMFNLREKLLVLMVCLLPEMRPCSDEYYFSIIFLVKIGKLF